MAHRLRHMYFRNVSDREQNNNIHITKYLKAVSKDKFSRK